MKTDYSKFIGYMFIDRGVGKMCFTPVYVNQIGPDKFKWSNDYFESNETFMTLTDCESKAHLVICRSLSNLYARIMQEVFK